MLLQGHPEEVYACEFLSDNRLLTASADKLFLWDLNTGTQLQQAQQTADTTKENGKPDFISKRDSMQLFNKSDYL